MNYIKKVINNYKEFNHRNPESYYIDNIPINDFIYVGTVVLLEYLSDKTIPDDKNSKIGKLRRHYHPFKKPHYVFTNREGNVLFIAPTKISRRGILD